MHYSFVLPIIPFLICIAVILMSCVGRWLIFSKTGHPGILSLVPVANLIIYGKIAGRIKSAVGILVSGIALSFMSAVLGSVYRQTENSPAIRSKAVLFCFILIGIVSLAAFIFYIRIILGVCSALALNKPLFIIMSLLILPVAEFLAGISIKNETSGKSVEKLDIKKSKKNKPRPLGQASSLEAFLDTDDEALALWNSGAIIVRDGVVINTALESIED